MTQTQTIKKPETVKRLVSGVFVNYQTVRESITGELVAITASADRGQEVDLPKVEAERLDGLGVLAPEGTTPEQLDSALADRSEAVKLALMRGVNPYDLPNLFTGEPVTVSPPGLGAAPAGTQTTGDTGIPDTTRNEGGAVLSPSGSAEAAAALAAGGDAGGGAGDDGYDARGKTVDELAQWIGSEQPNVSKTVAAAHDDPEAASRLIDAETSAHQGDPRATVIGPLEKIADAGEQRQSTGNND